MPGPGARGDGLLPWQACACICCVPVRPTPRLAAHLPAPCVPARSLDWHSAVGSGRYTMANVITNCYDSSAPTGAHTDGGTPAWVWAVVGSVLGCLALAGIAATLFFRRRRRQHAAEAAEAAAAGDESGRGLSKAGSGAELASLSMFGSQSYDKHLSGQPSGELHNQIMRTRFGPIDGVQLGELLGRGAFGRVYKGALPTLLPGAVAVCWRLLAGGCLSAAAGRCRGLHEQAAATAGCNVPPAAAARRCLPDAACLTLPACLCLPAGRWKGAIVAVKVIDHRVQPGKTYDLSREPLLR